MKHTLFIAGSTAFGVLLWFGLRSGSSAPAPLVTSSEPTALPMVQEQHAIPQAGPWATELTKISSTDDSAVALVNQPPVSPTQSPRTVPSTDSPERLDPESVSTSDLNDTPSVQGSAEIAREAPARTDGMTLASAQPPLRPTPAIRWPLALQELDLQVAGLNVEQLATLDEIADDFITKVGGEDQAAADPNYRKRWQAQQPTADQQFRALYGSQAFLRAQLATTHEATQSPPATKP